MSRRRKDIDTIVQRARSWSSADREALVAALMTPEQRLSLLAERVRRRVKGTSDREIGRLTRRAVKRVRRAAASP